MSPFFCLFVYLFIYLAPTNTLILDWIPKTFPLTETFAAGTDAVTDLPRRWTEGRGDRAMGSASGIDGNWVLSRTPRSRTVGAKHEQAEFAFSIRPFFHYPASPALDVAGPGVGVGAEAYPGCLCEATVDCRAS